MAQMNAALLAKYKAGEALSDVELHDLHYYYNTLAQAFDGYCPPEYHLVKDDVHRNLSRLTEARIARRQS